MSASQASSSPELGAVKMTPSSSQQSLRATPRSPSRQPSLSHASLTDLLSVAPRQESNVPPRDWRTIQCGELVADQELRFVEENKPIEEACQMLVDYGIASLPIKSESGAVIGTFDYSDLTAFLLMVLGVWKGDPLDPNGNTFQDIASQSRTGGDIPVKLVKDLGKKDPFITVSETEGLAKVVEILGSGVHRVAVTRQGTDSVIGVISQLRILDYFWKNAKSFAPIEQILPLSLRELNFGSTQVISINGDQRVLEALELMNAQGISSLAVIDNHNNVVGNISNTDVKHLTRSSSLPLIKSSCLHFLSVILTDRGLSDGKDSYPVFHVNPNSTLAHTVAKIIATKAHRMWLVEAPSEGNSAPSTPTIPPATAIPPPSLAAASPLSSSFPTAASLSVASMPGGRLSGRLIGVVSLTDILNLIGRSSGLTHLDPGEARRQRRRSSSSSVRASIDLGRSSFDSMRRA
ncbi:cell separation during budding [Orbilia brochopaga]|uniref:Cell separation during budding n=1 Tax=Orbilia brochopaga TaxID=3140254 RepID=A0AAV9VDE2_9PEZI